MKWLCVLLLTLALHAETIPTPLLPRDREMALALSAAPGAIADKADVWVLERNGYVKAREGSNGYTCLVSRTDHPLDLTPVCHDRNGTESHFQVMLLIAQLRAKGLDEPEVKRQIAAGYASGQLRVPQPGGISYMVSTEGYTWNPKTKSRQPVPPHVMVYAPYATNASLGIAPDRLKEVYRAEMPFVREEGTPHAFIIILTPHWKPMTAEAGGHH